MYNIDGPPVPLKAVMNRALTIMLFLIILPLLLSNTIADP